VSDAPYTLVAELTYRCPLRCAYCSNPTAYGGDTLDTAEWIHVFAEAEALGVVQLALTGGEPLLRSDLEELIRAARARELYVNLITSGVPLDRGRLASLRAAGLDHLQLSVQSPDAKVAEKIAGVDVSDDKQAVAAWAQELAIPLTVNMVLHRLNIDAVDDVVAFAERFGARRIELANTQYLGWALENRDALLPSSAQIERARLAATRARARLAPRTEVLFVLPDHHAGVPRACMSGWGRRYIVVAPDGKALPCHAAHTLPLAFPNVREASLETAWNHSEAFRRFRGTDWMPEPCRSCDQREVDFGGCRCQAFHLTGDAAATDPACHKAPSHSLVEAARARADAGAPTGPLALRHLPLAR